MRRSVVFALVAALAILALAGCSTPAPTNSSSGGTSGGASGGAAKTATVELKGFAFVPSSVEVAVGGTVTWKNADAVTHTVKGDGWGSGDLAQGASYSHTFDKPGTYAYSCRIHPSMTGEIVVK